MIDQASANRSNFNLNSQALLGIECAARNKPMTLNVKIRDIIRGITHLRQGHDHETYSSTCTRLSENFQQLITLHANKMQGFARSEGRLRAKLIRFESRFSALNSRLTDVNAAKLQLSGDVARLRSRYSAISKQIHRARSNVSRARAVASGHRRRNMAVRLGGGLLGFVLGGPVGFAVGAFIGDRAVRPSIRIDQSRIRHYRQERRLLKSEKEETRSDLKRKKNKSRTLTQRLNHIRDAKTRTQKKIRKLGRKISTAIEIKNKLERSSNRFRFLQANINLAVEYPDLKILKGREADQFLNSIKRIEKMYKKIT